jgi:3-isopropylmalate/(R)-2-methylmalate dehydratase small subunit
MNMEPFTTLSAIAAPLDEADIDTNQLCPTRFNKVPRGKQYAKILLHDRRFHADGSEKPDYILNREPYREAEIVVARRNFGVGSSREMAVFGLYEFGIRCVIAPSFGDIFHENCLKNGLLPVILADEVVATIMRTLERQPGAKMTINLPAQSVTDPDLIVHHFSMRSRSKRRLLNGLDDVDLTDEYRSQIMAFETEYRRVFDWL